MPIMWSSVDTLEKDQSIIRTLSSLRSRIDALLIVDRWEADQMACGVATPASPQRLVYSRPTTAHQVDTTSSLNGQLLLSATFHTSKARSSTTSTSRPSYRLCLATSSSVRENIQYEIGSPT